jgi:hypothetical protein
MTVVTKTKTLTTVNPNKEVNNLRRYPSANAETFSSHPGKLNDVGFEAAQAPSETTSDWKR